LGDAGEAALRRLKAECGFRFRFSMLNFVELLSHLGDAPSKETANHFGKYRAAFRRVYSLFDGVLPSAESVLMRGVGLKEHTAPNWLVDGASVQYQVEVIAKAETLEDVLKVGINPAHYKKLRAIDAMSFLGVVAEARSTITDPVNDLEAGGEFIVGMRDMHRILNMVYHGTDSAMTKATYQCIDELMTELSAEGCGSYRTNTAFMDKVAHIHGPVQRSIN
jgi:hypothetical protein